MTDVLEKWVEKEKRLAKLSKRRYLHFDKRIWFERNIKFFKKYFASKGVVTHSFYPFIKSDIITPRYKKTGEFDSNNKAIRKREDKVRPIVYASHFDSYIYSYYSTVLTYKYKKLLNKHSLNDCVLAYLDTGKSNIDHAHESFEFIKNKGQCTALAFDISGFFDGLDHEILKNLWSVTIGKGGRLPADHFAVYKSLTDYHFVKKETIYSSFPNLEVKQKKRESIDRLCTPKDFREIIRRNGHIERNSFTNQLEGSSRFGNSCGIPQGTPISACLSNIYMMNFDRTLDKLLKERNGLYRRYCDDILVVCDTEEAEEIKKFVLSEILKYELVINESKTEVTVFENTSNGLVGFARKGKEKNLQYLGFEFNGRNTYIRSSSMSRYYKRMTARIRENLKAAYGKNSIGNNVFRKKLYNRYTSKGERNFISYARRAAEKMNSETIHKQYKSSLEKVKKKMEEKKNYFEKSKKIERKKK
ncbi:MAG: hypothetical protein HRT58_21865 [Crocinitomicaceae bacterium]|nr:reverse transcriptase/maturase family protein [Flavobacteriales bacterium]NQZ38322.1 hypothetical protein [Crocinitomicaceae bacterium]